MLGVNNVPTRRLRLIALTLGLISFISVGSVWVICAVYKTKNVDIEVIKSLLTILTATVIAQVVALEITRYNDAQKVEAELDDLRTSVLARLNDAFVAVKRLRRQMRGTSVRNLPLDHLELSIDEYQKAMIEINDIQLTLEVIATDIETSASAFNNSKQAFDQVSGMEEYLNQIVDEWESGTRIRESELPALADLLGNYQTSKFRPQFVHNYYSAVEKLRLSRSNGKSRQWKRTFKLSDATASFSKLTASESASIA